MSVDAKTMHQILWNVFDEMLGLPTGHCETAPAHRQNTVAALICIFGQTNASLIVEAPEKTAELIAATMFRAPPESLCERDVLDAIGEISNMIGGNVKGTFTGKSSLSMPNVATQNSSDPMRPNEQHTWINVDNRPLMVRWQQMQSPG